jgi:hypothetical protein
MTTPDDDEDGQIPLLEIESSFEDPIISNRRAQPTSLTRFILTAAILLAFGYAAFLGWTHGQPIYVKVRAAHRAHARQIHFLNGTAVDESELVRPLFGRSTTDTAADRFDLVASIYFISRPDPSGRRARYMDQVANATSRATGRVTGNATASDPEADADPPSRTSSDEDNKKPAESEWERIFSEPVMRELQLGSSETAVTKVVLPGRIALVPPRFFVLS